MNQDTIVIEYRIMVIYQGHRGYRVAHFILFKCLYMYLYVCMYICTRLFLT